MALLKILQYPDPRLKRKAVPVKDVHDPEIQRIIDDMFKTMYAKKHCAGLSSTQLDLEIPWAITVIDESADNKQPMCLINPEIISTEGTATYSEACMSVYPSEISAKVTRPEKVTFRALDHNGDKIEMTAEGFFAICFQHEFDHLNGKLFIDHLSPLKRKLVDKKIKKVRKQQQ
ncbi:MAG: peptide deformylase [Gammaproteobacteria bacterium]|nr:peptide deformylase [Gammaproteobacteria bacterium]